MSDVEQRLMPVTLRDIQTHVCQRYGISLDDMLSERHFARFVKPRHIAIYLSRKMTKMSLPEIARRFGNRDHTTAVNAVQKVPQRYLEEAEKIREELETSRKPYPSAS